MIKNKVHLLFSRISLLRTTVPRKPLTQKTCDSITQFYVALDGCKFSPFFFPRLFFHHTFGKHLQNRRNWPTSAHASSPVFCRRSASQPRAAVESAHLWRFALPFRGFSNTRLCFWTTKSFPSLGLGRFRSSIGEFGLGSVGVCGFRCEFVVSMKIRDRFVCCESGLW